MAYEPNALDTDRAVSHRVRMYVLVDDEHDDKRLGRIERLERVAASTPELREWVKVLLPRVGGLLAAIVAAVKWL